MGLLAALASKVAGSQTGLLDSENIVELDRHADGELTTAVADAQYAQRR